LTFGWQCGINRSGTEACASYSGHCFVESEIGEVLKDLWIKSKECGFEISYALTPRTLHCGLYGDSAFTIAPNGDLYKCWEHVGDEQHLMGKINSDGDVSEITFAYFDWMSRNPLTSEKCKKCSYLPTCGGGCGSISFENEKTYHAEGCHRIIGVIEKQINLQFEKQLKRNA